MKVLIGVDGSSNSFAAVEFVGRLLSAERDELVLLYAVPEMSIADDDRLVTNFLSRVEIFRTFVPYRPQVRSQLSEQRHQTRSLRCSSAIYVIRAGGRFLPLLCRLKPRGGLRSYTSNDLLQHE